MKTKQIRRHHINRLKHNRKHDNNVSYAFTQNLTDCQKRLARHITTPAICSCWMCGNPRKYHGNGKDSKTIQELRAINDEMYYNAVGAN